MKRWAVLVLFLFLAGCASVNDAIVRRWFQDTGYGDQVNSQIRRGLERRMSAPQRVVPKEASPEFLDQG